MDSSDRLVFKVDDFDEAYVGTFTGTYAAKLNDEQRSKETLAASSS